MEHLLRDVPFILETDHENLTRIYSSGSPKVYRWQLELQSCPFTIRHIKGEDNEVADALSRLCPVSDPSEYISAFEEFAEPEELLAFYGFTQPSHAMDYEDTIWCTSVRGGATTGGPETHRKHTQLQRPLN
jgi:hypothetical protein